MDGTEFANANINEGLDSTLSIAWNELKYKTTVTKEYGQLPRVWCNLGQLNQVFLNILVNAAHAIVDHGEIRITTWEEDDAVRIAISDTGGGIPPENLKRIFDPFFTTKEVGKGTGLGLAIAYDIIVNKHNGRIEVVSEIGVGTTFTIMLPVTTTQEEKRK
jgi:two-component system NtrC family sensor kinase